MVSTRARGRTGRGGRCGPWKAPLAVEGADRSNLQVRIYVQLDKNTLDLDEKGDLHREKMSPEGLMQVSYICTPATLSSSSRLAGGQALSPALSHRPQAP